MCQYYTQMFIDITGIDLFDQNVGMARLNIESDVPGYHWH